MKRYLHNKSFYHLITSRMGILQPVGGLEVLAGDTVQIQNSGLIRVTPPATPVMHPVTVKFYNFFVPNRILDPADKSFEWEKFITGGEDGLYSTPPPRASGAVVSKGSVAESFGIPPGTQNYNAFLPKAYCKIWNEFFRDQQLQAEVEVDTYDGTFPAFNIAWEKDYFTSARPDDTLGPDVTLPLGTSAPVERVSNAQAWKAYTAQSDVLVPVNESAGINSDLAGYFGRENSTNRWSMDPDGGLIANLSEATAFNVNDLREAFALQRYQEARNLYGSRFSEYLRYLGISSSDARLQRPELISSGKSVINFSEVLQTSESATTPLGTMGGHGIAGVRSRKSRYFCEEHGHIIMLMAVRPKTVYSTAKHKMFDRFTKEDYWQKELQAIGMDEIYNQEVNADHTDPNGVFGYTNRYESFKRPPSYVSGDFRDTLNDWHLAREIDDVGLDQTLDGDFIQCNPTNRIYQDTGDTDKLWCTIRHRIAVRSMLRKSTQNRII